MKKMISSLVCGMALLGISSIVHAEDGTKEATSDATILVTAGEAIPTDPEDPNEPVDPEDPNSGGTTGQAGPLSIDQVVVFSFENLTLSGSAQDIPLKIKTPQNIQVTDSRGTGAGWVLSVKQSELIDKTDSSKSLKGAYIQLKKGQVTPGTGNAQTDDVPIGQAINAMDKSAFVPLLTAKETTGLGTWKYAFNQTDDQDILLHVPAGNMIGDYRGTVTWELSDSPQAAPAS